MQSSLFVIKKEKKLQICIHGNYFCSSKRFFFFSLSATRPAFLFLPLIFHLLIFGVCVCVRERIYVQYLVTLGRKFIQSKVM